MNWKNFLSVVALGLLVGCGADTKKDGGSAAEPNNSTNPNGDNSNQPGTDQPTLRDVRQECVDELVRLESCAQATAEEREFLESEFCNSTDYTDGQVATVASCLAQWTCGGAVPACLEDSDPAPECVDETNCQDGESCLSGVCQPAGGSQCTQVRYAVGDVGNGTNQKRTGDTCLLPGECLSERCVTAGGGDGDVTDNVSWCGNKGDCRNPNNADEECPSGYSCEEVLRAPFEDQPLWLCVKESVSAQMCR